MKNSFVGNPVERREDLRFVRGRGLYVDDLRPEGLLHAVIRRSSVAHGVESQRTSSWPDSNPTGRVCAAMFSPTISGHFASSSACAMGESQPSSEVIAPRTSPMPRGSRPRP